ncbi:MAG: hypothetical protein MZV63_46900 [Marinilabiliales bacterium]|nr:hypothetical protein [Marinilabiliales bacterium]
MGVLKPLDWVIILIYFAIILGLAWKVMRQKQKTSDEYFLAGRNLGWLDHRGLHLRFEHRVGASRRPGRFRSDRRRGHGPLRAARLVPAGARLGDGSVLHALAASSRCRSSWSGGSRRRRGRCFPLISLVAYVLTKIAVGIFAGGVVFGVLLPEVNLRGCSTASGSAPFSVIVITGLYTVVGGHARGGLHRGRPDGHPHHRVGPGDVLRPEGARRLGRAPRDRRRPRCSTSGSRWSPRGWRGPGPRSRKRGRMAWYFNDNYPWIGMLFCAPDHRPLVLVHRPVHRPARARRARTRREARRGSICGGLLQAAPGLHLHHPRHDLPSPWRKSGQDRRLSSRL